MSLSSTASGAAPESEAQMLGVRLAQTGSLATLLPAIAAKEREELVEEHPDWSAADHAELRAIADELAEAGIARITAAIGNTYAQELSLEDLHALVAFNESPLAKRWRETTPGAMAEAMAAAGGMDFKDDARKAYRARTGKG